MHLNDAFRPKTISVETKKRRPGELKTAAEVQPQKITNKMGRRERNAAIAERLRLGRMEHKKNKTEGYGVYGRCFIHYMWIDSQVRQKSATEERSGSTRRRQVGDEAGETSLDYTGRKGRDK